MIDEGKFCKECGTPVYEGGTPLANTETKAVRDSKKIAECIASIASLFVCGILNLSTDHLFSVEVVPYIIRFLGCYAVLFFPIKWVASIIK